MGNPMKRPHHDSGADSDTLSLISTVASEQQDQYEIDKILAEREIDGEKQWLVAWLGYASQYHTWEPRENFTCDDTFDDWRDTQMRITRGLENPFDVARWEAHVTLVHEATRRRKKRRRQKRREAGWQIPESSCSDEDFSQQTNSDETGSPKSKPPRDVHQVPAPFSGPDEGPSWTDEEARALEAGIRRFGGPSMDRILEIYGIHGTENQVLSRRTVLQLQAKADEMKMEFVHLGREPPDYLKGLPENPLPKQSDILLQRQRTLEAPRGETVINQNPVIRAFEIPKPRPPSLPESRSQPAQQTSSRNQPSTKRYTGTAQSSTTVVPKPNRKAQLGKVGTGPARSAAPKFQPSNLQRRKSIADTDVAANWNALPRMRKRRPEPSNPIGRKGGQTAKPPKLYKTLSRQNTVYKQGRNEIAPNVDQLIFIDPKTGKAAKTLESGRESTTEPIGVTPKTPFQPCTERLATRQAHRADGNNAQKRDEMTVVEEFNEPTAVTSAKENNEETECAVNGRVFPQASLFITSDDTNVKIGISQPPLDRTGTPAPLPSSSPPANPPAARRRSLAYDSWRPANRHSTLSAQPPFSDNVHYNPAHTLEIDLARRSPFQQNSTSTMSTSNTTTPGPFSINSSPSSVQKHNLFQMRQINHVIGNILTGFDRKDLGRVKFCGLTREQQRLILRIRKPDGRTDFQFTKVCTAMEYNQYFFQAKEDATEMVCSGYVVPYYETLKEVENMAAALGNRLAGALFFSATYTMLIWPVGSSVWQFLDRRLPEVPAGAELRFAVRTALSTDYAQQKSTEIVKFAEEKPNLYEETLRKIQDTSVDRVKAINAVFRDVYGIEYSRLATNNDPKITTKNDTFFLCFLPVTQELWEKDPNSRRKTRERTTSEHDYFVKFLRANGAKEIYSTQSVGSPDVDRNGAWDYFRHNVKFGCIVFHEDFIRHDQVVGLGKLLRSSSIDVFQFNMNPILTPKFPHLIRLFPHGGCLLITDSLFLRRPNDALRILRWLRLDILQYKPFGSWKVAMRTRPMEWMLKMMDKLPGGEEVDRRIYQLYADICSEVVLMLVSGREGSQSDDIDLPKPDAPIICPDVLREFDFSVGCYARSDIHVHNEAMAQNDNILVNWFAETSMTRFEQFRKFQIISGYDRRDEKGVTQMTDWANRYAHCEIFSAETFCESFRVTNSATLQKQEDERMARIRAEAPAKKAAALQAKKRTLENTVGALRKVMFEARKEGYSEDIVRWVGRKYLEQCGGFSAAEVERLEVLDGGAAVEPGEGGEHAWTRKLDIYGSKEKRREMDDGGEDIEMG